MKRQRGHPFWSRPRAYRRRSSQALAITLSCLLVLSGCGGGGEEGGGSAAGGDRVTSPAPAVVSCEGEIFIEAPVEAIDIGLQTLTLLDLTVHIDDQTQFNDVELADLMVGDYVDMRGFVDDGGALVVSCLELETLRDEVELRGPADAGGISSSQLFILGVEVQFSAATVFEDGELTQNEFFSQLQPGDLVAVRGQLGSIRAEEVEFDDSADDPGDEVVGRSSSDFNDYDDDDDFSQPLLDLDDDGGAPPPPPPPPPPFQDDDDDDGSSDDDDDDGSSDDEDDD